MTAAPSRLAPITPKVGFVSLGCPKAMVDSERILTQLRIEGYEVVNSYGAADLVVVNTCGFIEAAQEESLDAIGEALTENGKVIVTGCLGQREGLIRERHPDVLAITGPHNYEAVMRAVHTQLAPPAPNPYLDLVPASGIKLTPRHYAYLKISEGCNHKCTFCIIPKLRGILVSRQIDEVLREAETLVADGVKELLVVAQDTSAYGVDIKYATQVWRDREYRTHLTDLCRGLSELEVWVRLHYVYPYPHVSEVIPLMAQGRILPYLDIPLQHASQKILKAMRRPAASERALKRIHEWRAICPDLTIRSTFIVGFPGETDADFEELLSFIAEAKLDRVGCFIYSPVQDAEANALPDWVPTAVAEMRRDRFMRLQAEISATRLQRFLGRQLTVLVDTVNDGQGAARSFADAPEIDGVVTINGAEALNPGQFARVRVIGAGPYDLEAVPV